MRGKTKTLILYIICVSNNKFVSWNHLKAFLKASLDTEKVKEGNNLFALICVTIATSQMHKFILKSKYKSH